MKVKLHGTKRGAKQTASISSASAVMGANKVAPPPTTNATFLGVDAILYPKEVKNQSPQRRRGAKDRPDNNLQKKGLVGYGKAGARVSILMNEKMALEMEKRLQVKSEELKHATAISAGYADETVESVANHQSEE